MTEEIISRAQAQASGLQRYFTGKACCAGHIGPRQTTSGSCITCRRIAQKRWKVENPEKQRAKWRKLSARHRRENPERIEKNRNNWEHKNPDKVAARRTRWRAANPEKVKEQDLRSYIKNRDKRIAKSRRWHDANRLNPDYKGKVLARVRKWASDNPDRVRENGRKTSQTRRARQYDAGGSYTNAEIRELLERQNWCCAAGWCGVSLRKKKRELDHIIAVARGGRNDITNLQWLCLPCNRSKNAKDPIKWAQENGMLF